MERIFKIFPQTPENFANLVCFVAKITLNMGMGLECRRHIPEQSNSE